MITPRFEPHSRWNSFEIGLAVALGVVMVSVLDVTRGPGSIAALAFLVPFLLAVLTGAAKTTTA